MTWRTLLGKLGFPLFLGVCLLWAYVHWRAGQELAVEQRVADAMQRQARFDAERMASRVPLAEVSNCGLKDYGYNAVDVDGDPHHARQVMWTRWVCAEGTITIRGRLPRMVVMGDGGTAGQ